MGYKPLTDYSNITPFARCPMCRQLVKLETRTGEIVPGGRDCPFCHRFIDKKAILLSCDEYLKTTKAIQVAERFLDMFPLIFVVVLGEVFISAAPAILGGADKSNFLFILGCFVSVLILLGGFLNTQGWLSEFGNLQTDDEEFVAVKQKVRRSQIWWVWANIANLIWLAIYIFIL